MLVLSYAHRWLLSQNLRKLRSSSVHQKESVLKQTDIFRSDDVIRQQAST